MSIRFMLPLAATVLAAAAFGAMSAGAQPPGATPPAAAAPETPPPGEGLDVINEQCGFCHTTAQVFVQKPAAEWPGVVQSMIDRGAALEPAEQKAVTEYLVAHYAIEGSGTPAPSAAGGTGHSTTPPTPHIG